MTCFSYTRGAPMQSRQGRQLFLASRSPRVFSLATLDLGESGHLYVHCPHRMKRPTGPPAMSPALVEWFTCLWKAVNRHVELYLVRVGWEFEIVNGAGREGLAVLFERKLLLSIGCSKKLCAGASVGTGPPRAVNCWRFLEEPTLSSAALLRDDYRRATISIVL